MIKAIETKYKGYRFRSRLEARWAVFFDALGIKWEYEPEGFDLGSLGYYLPDFWLSDFEVYAEVKPRKLTQEEWAKCNALEYCLILDGSPQHKGWYLAGDSCYDRLTYEQYLADYNHMEQVELYASSRKKRLWFFYGSEICDYESPDHAIATALSARFEHGETPC